MWMCLIPWARHFRCDDCSCRFVSIFGLARARKEEALQSEDEQTPSINRVVAEDEAAVVLSSDEPAGSRVEKPRGLDRRAFEREAKEQEEEHLEQALTDALMEKRQEFEALFHEETEDLRNRITVLEDALRESDSRLAAADMELARQKEAYDAMVVSSCEREEALKAQAAQTTPGPPDRSKDPSPSPQDTTPRKSSEGGLSSRMDKALMAATALSAKLQDLVGQTSIPPPSGTHAETSATEDDAQQL